MIRLVCQELEGWYIGDLAALAAAFNRPMLDTPAHRKRFIDPDVWQKPSVEVKRLAPTFQKISGARAMAQHLNTQRSHSHSLRVFVAGLQRLASSMGYQAP